MEIDSSKFEKYVFVCEREREGSACCAPDGALIRAKLKDIIKERGLGSKIRVSASGCLDVCAQGPNVLIMPDAKWLKNVSLSDIDAAIEEIIK
jgi:(2Fe-2S) ferredoxin